MQNNKIHQGLIAEVKKILNPYNKKLLIEKQDGVGLIQVFSEEEMVEGERNKFRIALSDMLLLDNKKQPFIVIEPETSSSPKTFGRSIPVYAVARKIIADKPYPFKSALLLIIVIPDDKKNPSQKKYQLEDLQRKMKSSIKLRGSKLADFAFCQISNFENTVRKMIDSSNR
jgi:hypothetical protein